MLEEGLMVKPLGTSILSQILDTGLPELVVEQRPGILKP